MTLRRSDEASEDEDVEEVDAHFEAEKETWNAATCPSPVRHSPPSRIRCLGLCCYT